MPPSRIEHPALRTPHRACTPARRTSSPGRPRWEHGQSDIVSTSTSSPNVPVDADGTLGIVDGRRRQILTLQANWFPGPGVHVRRSTTVQRLRSDAGADGDHRMTRIEFAPGMLSTVRTGPAGSAYWHIGVPPNRARWTTCPSTIGNRVLPNAEGRSGTGVRRAVRPAVPRRRPGMCHRRPGAGDPGRQPHRSGSRSPRAPAASLSVGVLSRAGCAALRADRRRA